MAAPATPATVFIVDDDRGLVRLIEKALLREGFATASATSGKDALHWLARHHADLALLDLKLEDTQGMELVRCLRELPRPVPFLIITGQGDERVAVEMMKRGALDYLVKDVDFLQFVPEVVKRALEQLEREKRLSAAEAALRRSEASLARAQHLAHLGSYEISVPFSAHDHWSAETFRILGLDPAGGVLSPQDYLRRVVHPGDRARVQHAFDAALRDGKPFDTEYRIVRPDGAVRHVQSIGEPVRDAAGKVVRFVGTLLDLTERKRLESEILEISEREQRRIGQDLHDGLGQHLAGIELLSQVLEQNLAAKNKKHAARAAEIARHVREAISQTRALARGLSPVMVGSDGLMSALTGLAANTERLFRVRCQFECEPPVLVHNHSVATHLYRIAQEAVSNAIKHGQTRRVVIRLQEESGRTVLLVRDFGKGLPTELPEPRGMGLRIMQYRAGMIGGSLVVQREPEGGTSVVCSLQSQSTPDLGKDI
jgi:hypothetical protein